MNRAPKEANENYCGDICIEFFETCGHTALVTSTAALTDIESDSPLPSSSAFSTATARCTFGTQECSRRLERGNTAWRTVPPLSGMGTSNELTSIAPRRWEISAGETRWPRFNSLRRKAEALGEK